MIIITVAVTESMEMSLYPCLNAKNQFNYVSCISFLLYPRNLYTFLRVTHNIDLSLELLL